MNNAIRVIRIMLGNVTSVSSSEIVQKIDQVLSMPDFKDLDRQQLFREVTFIYAVRNEDYRIIAPEERNRPWLAGKKGSITWSFWNRYRSYLQDEKGFAPDTIAKLDRLTDRTIDSLFDPTENIALSKKGLCVGQVQSGKTANYTGLICKAADSGFRFVLVLAGIHNNLRSQTQLRLDEGFLGFDTQHQRAFNANNIRIGVGNINQGSIAHSLTSSLENGDFTQAAANTAGFNFNTNETIIAVAKKNPSVLRRLYEWLASQTSAGPDGKRVIGSKSLLLIDDEADHASINISNDPERRSTINGWITQIVSLFRKSGYVGYTATPFANIFIPPDEENLFPRDFIINIPPPSNYIGPEKVFGFQLAEEGNDTVLPIVNRIQDYSTFVPDKHKISDPLPESLPDSLCLAIRCFILVCATRRVRGQLSVHNSMLVHVSRFQAWQSQIRELVENQFDFYRRGIDQNDPDILELFRRTFEEDSEGYKSFRSISATILTSNLQGIDTQVAVHSWDELILHLNDAASRIVVREIRGGSKDALDYYDHKDGLSLIAIGGNKLSRGLTLEGLSVSYYLRSSRMYDTLMQMGRWFGYRPGYVDLCRLFTSRELNEWFCHIAHASEELREEFDYMSDVAGSTPEKYALKVRTHPGVLQISATNKMRSTVTIQVTWSARLVESYELQKNSRAMEQNFESLRAFIERLPNAYDKIDGNYLWRDIAPDKITNFLGNISSLDNFKAYDPRNLIRFIDKQLPNAELTRWRIVLMNKQESPFSKTFLIGGTDASIGSWIRRQDDNNSDDTVYYIRKSHIISPQDEFIDLNETQKAEAWELTRQQHLLDKKEGAPKYPSGTIVRNKIRQPKNPLLLIYLLDPVRSKTKLPEGSVPFVGYAISFPRSNFDNYVSYAVNEQLLDKFDFQDDDAEDEIDDN